MIIPHKRFYSISETVFYEYYYFIKYYCFVSSVGNVIQVMRQQFNIPETEQYRLFKTKEGVLITSVPLSCLDVTIYEAGLARITGVSYNNKKNNKT